MNDDNAKFVIPDNIRFPPYVCSFLCISPLCVLCVYVHSAYMSLRMYVLSYHSPRICKLRITLLVCVPSACMFAMCIIHLVYNQPCLHSTVCTLHRMYTPPCVHSTVCIFHRKFHCVCTPVCVHSTVSTVYCVQFRVYIPHHTLHHLYTPPCVHSTMCTLHHVYTAPCISLISSIQHLICQNLICQDS